MEIPYPPLWGNVAQDKTCLHCAARSVGSELEFRVSIFFLFFLCHTVPLVLSILMNMFTKCAFYFLSFLVVITNGLGRFVLKSQSQMHVIQRLDERNANDVVNQYRKPGLSYKVTINIFT